MGIAMVPRSDTKPTKPAVAQTQLKEKSIVAITIDKTSNKKRKRTLQKKSDEQKETQAKVIEKQAEEPKEERAHLLEEESDDEDAELLAAARVWADDATEQNVEEQHQIEKTFNFDEKQTPKESTVEDTDKVYSLHLTQLSYEANEFEIRTIFSEAGCLIQSIRLVYDGIGAERTFRGVAFLDVCDDKSFQKALSLNRRMLLGRKMNVRPTKTKDELTDIVARTKEIVAAKIQRQKDIQDGKENPVSDKRADKKDKKSFDKKDKTRLDKKDKKSFDKKEKKSFDKKDKKSFDKKDKKEFINDKQKRKSDVDSEVTLPNKKAKIMNGRSNDKTKEGSREPKGHSSKQSETQEKNKSSTTKLDASNPRPTNSKVIGSGEVTKLTKQERNRKAAILMGKRRAK